MLQKAARILYKISEIMELIMAFAVAICIAIAIIRFFPEIANIMHSTDSSSLIHFLEKLFYIIIAIEFL